MITSVKIVLYKTIKATAISFLILIVSFSIANWLTHNTFYGVLFALFNLALFVFSRMYATLSESDSKPLKPSFEKNTKAALSTHPQNPDNSSEKNAEANPEDYDLETCFYKLHKSARYMTMTELKLIAEEVNNLITQKKEHYEKALH